MIKTYVSHSLFEYWLAIIMSLDRLTCFLLDKLEQKNKRIGPKRKGGDGANGIKDHAQER